MHRSADPGAVLQAWREAGADRLDPMRFVHIEALWRRAGAHDGAVRQLLDARLDALMDAYGTALDQAVAGGWNAAADAGGRTPAAAAPGPLGALVALLARGGGMQASTAGAAPAAVAPSGQPLADVPDSWQAPAVLDEARQLWSRVRIEQQMRESLLQLPEDAGPLNSGVLVHRAFALMSELSPEYLQHFLTYVDALVWMQQLAGEGGGALAEPSRPAAKKRAAAKPRKRRAG